MSNADLGWYLLGGAALAAIGAAYAGALAMVVAAIATILRIEADLKLLLKVLLGCARVGMVGFTGLILGSAAILLEALIQGDFTLDYVVKFTDKALPIGYKFAAFWAGQEGSLLLWGCLLGAMAIVVMYQQRDRVGVEPAVTLVVLAVVCAFFALVMLFVHDADPFRLVELRPGELLPSDGHGLNPALRNIAMIAHPPTLFVGYAGFTIPFALMAGALAAGRGDADWLKAARPWILFSWLFLSIGIVLGSWWAYVALGWGGYWAWDPVENASLLPWLTATALLHCVVQYQRRNIFKQWTVSLIATTFLLCILATWITRSGMIQSVHSFARSVLGWIFLAFLAVATLGSAVLIVVRLGKLRPAYRFPAFLSREGTVLGGNILLVIIMLAVAFGTLFPPLSGLVLRDQVNFSAPFYNQIVLPLAIVLADLLAIGVLLDYHAVSSLADRYVPAPRPGQAVPLDYQSGTAVTPPKVPVAVYLLAAAMFATVGLLFAVEVVQFTIEAFAKGPVSGTHLDLVLTYALRALWVAAVAEVGIAIVAGVVVEVVSAVSRRMSQVGENLVVAALRAFDVDHRRWGGYVAHLGLAAIIVGVAGSSLFQQKQMVDLKEGQRAFVGPYRLTYEGFQETQHEGYVQSEAVLIARTPPLGDRRLAPRTRLYDKWEQPAGEVAIRYGVLEDLYVRFAGIREDNATAVFEVIRNPMVNWIWLGGVLLSLGAVLGLLPRLSPGREPAGLDARTPATAAQSPIVPLPKPAPLH